LAKLKAVGSGSRLGHCGNLGRQKDLRAPQIRSPQRQLRSWTDRLRQSRLNMTGFLNTGWSQLRQIDLLHTSCRQLNPHRILSNMAIPDYQACMLHLLNLASDGAEHTLKDAVPALAETFRLTDAERTELLPSGQQPVFHNRSRLGKHLTQEGRIAAGSPAWLLHHHRSRKGRSCTKSSQNRSELS
jgi:Mrr N-terminal domain